MNRQHHFKIDALVATHALISAILLGVTIAFKGTNWPSWTVLGYVAFLGSQLMLLGMFLGLSNANWWWKLLGLFLGVAWVAIILIGPSFPEIDRELLAELSGVVLILFACTLSVASTLGLFRKFVARIHWSDHWPSYPLLHDLQFSIVSLLALTTLTGALIAGAKFVTAHDETGMNYFRIGIIFAVDTSLITWVVSWAGLGCGQPIFRVPVAIAVASGLGLLMAYYAGTSEYLEFTIVSVMAGGIALASLFVVRRCGYRLVSIRNLPTSER